MGIIKDLFKKGKQDEVMPARCGKSKEDFDILLDNVKGRLTMIGSKRSEHTSSQVSNNSKGMKAIDLSNGLASGSAYHCPICGNKHIVQCGRCKRITCYDRSGRFTCAYCGNKGNVSGTMKRIEIYDPSGLKAGLKQDGMKYCPGDK